MSPVVWFLLGALVGGDAVLAGCWLGLRRANRGRELRWRVAGYTGRQARKRSSW